ncbi:MAG TPA: hypothetical protein VIZ67_04275 [Acidimicrobiales bacterium]
MPLVLNVVAALWVVRLLAPDLSFLRPSRRRPLDVAAVAAVVVALLHLPGIVFVGMEHTLHLALVLAAVLAGGAVTGRPMERGAGPCGRRMPAARSPSCAASARAVLRAGPRRFHPGEHRPAMLGAPVAGYRR